MKMYKVSGANTLYFIWSDWTIKEVQDAAHHHVQLHIRDCSNDIVEECEPSEAFGIRYGSQPIYKPYRSNFEYGWANVDKKELKAELGILGR